jgi:hypothetical protein
MIGAMKKLLLFVLIAGVVGLLAKKYLDSA